MPHSHSTTELYARTIENQIEKLLKRGNEIANVLNKEKKYAQRKYRQQSHSSHSNSKSCSKTRSSAVQPANLPLICHSTDPSDPPFNSAGHRHRMISKEAAPNLSRHNCVQLSKGRVIDLKTNVEMRCFPVKSDTIKTSKMTFNISETEKIAQKSHFFKDSIYTKFYTNKRIITAQNGNYAQQYLVKTTVFVANDPENKWIRINEIWNQADDGKQIVNLWTDLFDEKTREVWTNGKLIKS